MEDIFKNYIQSISPKFLHEETTEMGYRADFEFLLKEIFKSINVTRFDHDARAKEGNKPDFVVIKHNIPDKSHNKRLGKLLQDRSFL